MPWPSDDFRRALAALTPGQRTTFAANCASHLLPLYRRFVQENEWGDPGVVEACLAFAEGWNGSIEDNNSAQDLIAACKQVTPDTEDFEGFLVSRALDAATAAVYAVRACSPDNLASVEAVAEICWDAAFGLEQEADAEGPEAADLTGKEELRQWHLLEGAPE